MLHRQDYILRLIEQMGQVLVQILNRILNRQSGQPAEVEADLDGLAHRAGLNLEIARRLAPESLHIMVAPAGKVDPSRCWLLAELLYLHGLQAEAKRQAEIALGSYARSLYLYRLVEPEWQPVIELPAAGDRIREMEARVREIGRSAEGGAGSPLHSGDSMTAEEKRNLVDRYLAAYNAADVDGMLALLHPDATFQNVSGGEVDASAVGAEEFRRLAEQSKELFSSRRQEITSFELDGDTAVVGIRYEGVLASDLPNRLKAGETLRLRGRSEFGFRDGLIDRITDTI